MTTDPTWIWTSDLGVKENVFEKESSSEWCGMNTFPWEPDWLRQQIRAMGGTEPGLPAGQWVLWVSQHGAGRNILAMGTADSPVSVRLLCTEDAQTGETSHPCRRNGSVYRISIGMFLPNSKHIWVLAPTLMHCTLWTTWGWSFWLSTLCPQLANKP